MSKPATSSLRGYGGYVEKLSRRVSTRLASLEAMYNFDLGQEFEIAVCQLFSEILPSKYGVCRGFVVSRDGEVAGDDVIVFDRHHYPTLRSSMGATFALKDQIPVDAVYAYIECKHSIDAATFRTAAGQTSKVKEVLLTRGARPNPEYETRGPVYKRRVREWPRSWPERKDQPFTMIISRKYELESAAHPDCEYPPDLSVLGADHIMAQRAALGPDGIKGALFFDDKHWAKLEVDHVPGMAYGLGVLMLMQAIGWIELGQPDWSGCLNEAFWESAGASGRQ